MPKRERKTLQFARAAYQLRYSAGELAMVSPESMTPLTATEHAARWARLQVLAATIKHPELRAQQLLEWRKMHEKESGLTETDMRNAGTMGTSARKLEFELAGANDLNPTSVAIWSDQPTPERLWLVQDWIPMGRATLLTGNGGTGKSLVAQQLATCVAAGRPFMGLDVRKMPTLYLTCEDDSAELHRRQKAICQREGIPLASLDGKMWTMGRTPQLSYSLIDFGQMNGPGLTQYYRDVRHTCHAHGIKFLVLDNIAHLFEGNENIRHEVATFCNALERLAIEIGGAVLFLGHPPKTGAQFSGSTAWENQVRSRIFLERPGKEDGSNSDPDARVLTRSKSNYARTGDEIRMRWHEWAFEPEGPDLPAPSLVETQKATRFNALFLKLLDLRVEQERPVSTSRHAPAYAPKAMALMTEARGAKIADLEAAMERLFSLGQIAEGNLFRGSDRHWKRGLAPAGRLRDGYLVADGKAAQVIENACGTVLRDGLREGSPDLREGSAQVIENACGEVAGRRGEVPGASGAGESPPYRGGTPPSHSPDAGGLDDE